MMRERPILFSAPMVRAILAGTKTQTRRVVKPWNPLLSVGPKPVPGDVAYLPDFTCYRSTCPYGQPGDRLWVRETFTIEHSVEPDQKPPHNDGRPIKRRLADDYEGAHPLWRQAHYRATDPTPELVYEDGPAGGREDEIGVRWKPSIHMPRWASRITLEITGVRVERLQDISEADAQAEGVHTDPACPAYDGFKELWRSINGADSWAANPWVWVVEFKRIAAAPANPINAGRT